MNLMPQEVEYTLTRHPEHAKINEALYDWYVLAHLVEKAKQIDT